MSWQTFIFSSVILYSISVLLQRVVIKDEDSDPWAYSIFFQLLVGIIIGTYGLLTSGKIFTSNILTVLPNIVIMTLLWSLANIFIFTSLKKTEASVFTVIFSSRVLFTTVASSLFLSEFLAKEQLVGMLLILVGVAVVSLKKIPFKFERNQVYALLGAICVGIVLTNDRFILKSMDVYTYSTISYIFPAVLLTLIKPNSIKKFGNFTRFDTLKKMILLCIFWVGFALTFNAALKVAPNSSQVASISVSSVVLTVILSIIFLKERENIGKKIIGSIITFGGLLLVN